MQYEKYTEVHHVLGQYIPTYKADRGLPVNIEEFAKHQSTVIIYCQVPTIELEHNFIHELIHHIQFSHHVGLVSETHPDEDEHRMLEIAERFIPDSWITREFAATLDS